MTGRLELRPVAPDDREAMRAAYAAMSDESRYRRFLSPHPVLTERELRYFTDVDHVTHEAIVAVDRETGEGAGVARFVGDPRDPSSAEIAITVVDRWQGQGLGRALLAALAGRAREEGVERFTATILDVNRAMIALLDDLGEVELLARSGGASEYAVAVPPAGLGCLEPVLRCAAETTAARVP